VNILITAGGTVERIDNVRSIANTSTGKLSLLIAEAFAALGETERIFYVCGPKALRPDAEKAEIFPVESVSELADTVTELAENRRIDAVVHAMAVSDYAVRAVSSAGAIAEDALLRLGAREDSDSAPAGAYLRDALRESFARAEVFSRDGKIPSDAEDLVILMKRTPKVISMLRGLLPHAVIVGFKLLDGVPLAELIDAGRAILKRNDCDFVLANDLKNIGGAGHVGHLIDSSGAYVTYNSKEEIARGVVGAVTRGGMR
jgi:phosphopantothenate-cysteine ligase